MSIELSVQEKDFLQARIDSISAQVSEMRRYIFRLKLKAINKADGTKRLPTPAQQAVLDRVDQHLRTVNAIDTLLELVRGAWPAPLLKR